MPLIVTDQLGNPYTYVWNTTLQQFDLTPVQNVSPSTADNSVRQTAIGVITSAARLIGVVASGESLSLSEATDGLNVLCQMLDSWNADRLSIFTTAASDYPLVGGKQSYTLGPGGDFNADRPAQIDGMSMILLYNPSNPVEIPIDMYSVTDWQTKVPVKNVPGSFPLLCYDDGGFPLRTLNMWPIPQGQPVNARIYAWQALGLPPTLQSSLAFPAGYAQAFRYNLAVLLAAEFGAQVRPDVQQIAVESLGRVKTMNAPDLSLRSDLVASPAGYNYKADLFGIPY